jgi:hypothetical protein
MTWPFHNRTQAKYWLKVFGLYALFEGFIQLLYNYLLNEYGQRPISNLEFHGIMWLFQCLLIYPIWWVAWSVRLKKAGIQVVVNVLFFIAYSIIWFGPVQDIIQFLHQGLQQFSRAQSKRVITPVDTATDLLPYQLLKHTFRLSWFFLANYLYHYRHEEQRRMELDVANKDLQLKLLKWHLNPGFYFKTIDHLQQLSSRSPASCSRPILQLAKVMEYVIYEAKEKLIDVSKEINFLDGYVQLINQQAGSTAHFTIQSEGATDRLKIPPLLLAGFIDRIASSNNDIPSIYKMQLHFSGNNMSFIIEGDLGRNEALFFGQNNQDRLYRRFQEIYADQFTYRLSSNKNFFEINVRLNEEA